jgi:hypothetical protein
LEAPSLSRDTAIAHQPAKLFREHQNKSSRPQSLFSIRAVNSSLLKSAPVLQRHWNKSLRGTVSIWLNPCAEISPSAVPAFEPHSDPSQDLGRIRAAHLASIDSSLNITMAPRTHLAIGSSPWINAEKENMAQLLEQEKDELVYPAQHEMEWLNEHMTEIFSKRQLYLPRSLSQTPLTMAAMLRMSSRRLEN